MSETVHIVVRGIVQGVGFRHFVAQTARRLGVAGWVRNLPSGEVEVLAGLPADSRERFLAALRRGPPASRVDDIDISPADASALPPDEGFHVRH